MDLNWCVICDQHVDEALDSSLYCSEICRLKDQKAASTVNLSTSPSSSLNLNTASRLMKTPAMISRLAKKPAATALSTTSYPWVPLYRKRHGIAVARRCTPNAVNTLATKPFTPIVI